MPRLSKPQAKALAAFSMAIVKDEGCGLNAAAKKPPFAGNPAALGSDKAVKEAAGGRSRAC